ncbi:alanine racemase [Parachitinimonas caeni]|uniref:Alanine racemase n=1 Tax=Parachitinimonas caeni TaxID=3031301 RepID=A0ABT7DZT1_9NEIS|nr:alanine racemase [Parachitinimonas caeni]MDK2124675.1 alanine racemase [Parachitinimonas caeni]
MSRPAVATIRLDNLRHNYQLARQLHGGRALAVVKANAYGHGAVECSRALLGLADGFGVACIEEALQLREAGIQAPILLLEGFFSEDELPLIAQHRLWTALHSPEQLAMLQAWPGKERFPVWLKLDSGMHRLGFDVAGFRSAFATLQQLDCVEDIVLMSHFSRADELACDDAERQTALFDEARRGLESEASLSNSAGILAQPLAQRQWGRPGIMLYGATPLDGDHALASQLRPVMQLQSEVIALHRVAAGEPIGYGHRWVAPRDTLLATVAMGYADGYPRATANGCPVLVDGQLASIAGRVSMDMIMVDVTAVVDARVGSKVLLWGEALRPELVAAHAGTIPYEMFCNIKRVRFEYQGG